MGEQLSDLEIEVRETFIRHFRDCGNRTISAIRMGYPEKEAAEMGRFFYYDSYVQNMLSSDKTLEYDESDKDNIKKIKSRISHTALQIMGMYATNPREAVAAMGRLIEIHGLKKSESVEEAPEIEKLDPEELDIYKTEESRAMVLELAKQLEDADK